MDDIEKIKMSIGKIEKSYYPNIYNNTFSEDLFKQTDFNIYKIKNKEENVKKLLNEYNKINNIQTKIIKYSSLFQITKNMIYLRVFIIKVCKIYII